MPDKSVVSPVSFKHPRVSTPRICWKNTDNLLLELRRSMVETSGPSTPSFSASCRSSVSGSMSGHSALTLSSRDGNAADNGSVDSRSLPLSHMVSPAPHDSAGDTRSEAQTPSSPRSVRLAEQRLVDQQESMTNRAVNAGSAGGAGSAEATPTRRASFTRPQCSAILHSIFDQGSAPRRASVGGDRLASYLADAPLPRTASLARVGARTSRQLLASIFGQRTTRASGDFGHYARSRAAERQAFDERVEEKHRLQEQARLEAEEERLKHEALVVRETYERVRFKAQPYVPARPFALKPFAHTATVAVTPNFVRRARTARRQTN